MLYCCSCRLISTYKRGNRFESLRPWLSKWWPLFGFWHFCCFQKLQKRPKALWTFYWCSKRGNESFEGFLDRGTGISEFKLVGKLLWLKSDSAISRHRLSFLYRGDWIISNFISQCFEKRSQNTHNNYSMASAHTGNLDSMKLLLIFENKILIMGYPPGMMIISVEIIGVPSNQCDCWSQHRFSKNHRDSLKNWNRVLFLSSISFCCFAARKNKRWPE